ncbi:MAG: HAD family hydrolase [Candidatus Thorarchaeota archaeon]|nr:HAD family hydrolase [Candidatus Thorarchaeota archaeon]
MFKAVIFDLDGTIIQLDLPLERMRDDAKNYYINEGLPPELLEPADGISSSTAKAKEHFLTNGLSQEEWDVMQQELDVLMSKHEKTSAKHAHLMDGVLESVQAIKSMGIRTAILTNNSRHATDIILKQLPLEELFEVIQTRHESPTPKPYPDGLIHIIEKLGIKVDEAVYVGDAVIDGVASSRAGMHFWGVSTGETKAQDLESAGAERVLASLREIPSLLSACQKDSPIE